MSSDKATAASTAASICRPYPQAVFAIDIKFYLWKQKVRNVQIDKQSNEQLLYSQHTQWYIDILPVMFVCMRACVA